VAISVNLFEFVDTFDIFVQMHSRSKVHMAQKFLKNIKCIS